MVQCQDSKNKGKKESEGGEWGSKLQPYKKTHWIGEISSRGHEKPPYLKIVCVCACVCVCVSVYVLSVSPAFPSLSFSS
jgi:hypothetical protein